MKKDSNMRTALMDWDGKNKAVAYRLVKWGLALGFSVLVAGCQSPAPPPGGASQQEAVASAVITLREGDVLRISFPGSPTLDTTQQIRRDGKITLPLVGEVQAAGVTPEALQQNLINLYAPQLSSKQVTVTVTSSTFSVFVTGSVIRPGEIISDRPITALEAIMKAGGVDYTKANLRAVTVTRLEGGQFKTYTLNLKLVLEGKTSEPFYLKPSDIVKVPERFTWF
jgi:polysaccharide export outer membrane protein